MSDRTLTAVRSPLTSNADAGAASAMLVMAGRAHAPPAWGGDRGGDDMGPRSRLVNPAGLTLGRMPPPSDAGPSLDPGHWGLADPLISGTHARLQPGPDGMWLEDLGSKNGTFVGAERIRSRALVPAGRPFFLGGHAFVWRRASPQDLLALEREAREPLGPVATANPPLARITERLRLWAKSGEDLLLQGETGVGKEVYAQAVHAFGGRAGPFVAINCAALPRDLVESELFGYRAGAHSTARASKPGLIEQADGGTLFLDEIGEMPPEAQAKLLRFLQDRLLVPLGATQPRRLDVRILSATNRPVFPGPGAAVREDLLARLGAAPVVLPPLRERLEDLGALAAFFLARRGMAELGFETPVLRALFLYSWPLNVRELEKVLGAAASLTEGRRPLALSDLPDRFALGLRGESSGSAPSPTEAAAPAGSIGGRKPPRPGPSRDELESLLAAHQGNVADVSRALGRQRAAVWRWIKRFGLRTDGFRDK